MNKTSVVDIHMKKGKRPEFDVYIGRFVNRINVFFYDSKWANPRLTLEEYRLYIKGCIDKLPEVYNLDELKDKKLGCWCITTDSYENPVCHGQILMKLIAEKEVSEVATKRAIKRQ